MANIQINITENGTTTLATSGCICDRNIDINVDVAGSGGNDVYTPTDAELTYTGTCDYAFSKNGWVINSYGDRMTTTNVDSANHMFDGYKGESIPFDINFAPRNSTYINEYMFSNCNNLKELPIVRNLRLGCFSNYIFHNCYNIRTITADKFPDVDFSYYQSYPYGQQQSMFPNCYSLRKIDKELLDELMKIDARSSAITYYGWFQYCASLDELKDLYVVTDKAVTSNAFNSFATDCYRLKTFTFATDNGVPKVVQWKSQTIDLSDGVGYCDMNYWSDRITDYNSGCTAEDRVFDSASYEALKNTENWWCTSTAYSRFNHDSAVETINSLPDASAYLATAGGTNTIKFRGSCGANTDGGAISNLTEEEIAVATAKGWTVTIV